MRRSHILGLALALMPMPALAGWEVLMLGDTGGSHLMEVDRAEDASEIWAYSVNGSGQRLSIGCSNTPGYHNALLRFPNGEDVLRGPDSVTFSVDGGDGVMIPPGVMEGEGYLFQVPDSVILAMASGRHMQISPMSVSEGEVVIWNFDLTGSRAAFNAIRCD